MRTPCFIAKLVLSAQDLQDVASELLADVLAIHLSREPLVIERAPVGGEGSGSEVQAREAYYTACVQLTLGPGQQ